MPSLNNASLPVEIDAAAVKAFMDQQVDFLLIDCRESDERAVCQIANSVLIPMNETPQRLAELERYRDRPIVVHCHGGVRSLRVTHFLREQGFNHTQSMAGGIDAWSVFVDNSVPRY